MADDFKYDVFLSHNSKDKPQVRRLAERLRAAGLRVWFDDWIIKPGDDIYLTIERGLETSRTLLLCLSAHALSSGWVTSERSVALFRDPTNERRRFIPVLLSECQLPDTLRRYKYLSFQDESEAAFNQLLEACRPSEDPTSSGSTAINPSQKDAPAAASATSSSSPAPGPAPSPGLVELTGNWTATLCKGGGQPCKVYLALERMDNLLFGSVSYPTGNAGILDGKIEGQTISFMTRHVPNWTSQEVTIKWAAKIVGDELQGFTQDPDGPGKFTAVRSTGEQRYGWNAG
jgi:hypothetical protein